MKALQKLCKMFFISSKSYFSSRDTQTFFLFISQFSDSKGKMEVE